MIMYIIKSNVKVSNAEVGNIKKSAKKNCAWNSHGITYKSGVLEYVREKEYVQIKVLITEKHKVCLCNTITHASYKYTVGVRQFTLFIYLRDWFLFLVVKLPLKRARFANIEAVEAKNSKNRYSGAIIEKLIDRSKSRFHYILIQRSSLGF